LGICFEEDRNNLTTIFQNKLNTSGFKFSKNYSLTKLFNCENEIFSWNENGLPNDDISIENAIITLNSDRTCYLIDPQYQAKDWLINQLNIKPEYIFDKPEGDLYLRGVEQAIINGETILVNDTTGNIDPLLDNIIDKNIYKKYEKQHN